MKKSISKVVSWLLCLCMLLSILPFGVFAAVDYDEDYDDYYNVISKDDYELAPGIVESEIVLNNDAGSHRQVAHVVEVDINNPYTKVIPSYKGMIPEAGKYGVQIMSQQAKFAEENGYGNVVAAMNLSLSWYDSAYYKAHPELVGEPLGYMILDGQMFVNSQGKTSGAQTCLVINFDEKDGVARPAEMPKTEIRSTSSPITGWEEQVIPANFGFLVKNGVNQYKKDHSTDPASRSFVGIKADGTIVMVMNDGRQSPYSAGFNNYEMAQFMLSLGCVQAINGDGGGSSAFLSQRPGEELKINCSPSDGAERETTHGILVISTAPATGEFVRAHIDSANDYYIPNSTVKFTATGVDLVGTPAEIPADATWALSDGSFGTIDAEGTFVSNGKEGSVDAQLVYNGAVVGSHTIHIVMPDTIHFVLENMTVPYGKTVNLGMTATYNSKDVTFTPDDVLFELSNSGIGTIEGFEFTAAEEGTAVTNSTLTATIGAVSKTISISLGRGSVIAYDFEDNDITGWRSYSGYGQYGPKGSAKDENGNYYYNGQNELGEARIVTAETGKVRNGNYALALEGDFTQIYETGYHARVHRLPETLDMTDAVALGMWLYVPEEGMKVEIRLSVNNSYISAFDNGQLMDLPEGWNYISIDISQIANKTFNLITFQIDDRACASNKAYYDYITEPNLAGKYTFYVDDITIDYSSAVEDREIPVFAQPVVFESNVEMSKPMNGVTVSTNELSFEASVTDNMTKDNAVGLDESTAKAYIDGYEVECKFNNGKISVVDAVLADGFHTVTFSICDKLGNYSHVSGQVNVQANTGMSTIKLVPQNPDADKILIGSLYWTDLVATDIETVEQVEVTLDLDNASSWELEGMELAEGFTAEYSIVEDDNIATIVITRTGENKLSGEAVLASIPVRTWESTITECEGYEDQTPEKLWSRGIIWSKAVTIDLDRGVMTSVDGSVTPFGAEDIEVFTEIWFTYYSRKSNPGALEDYASKKAWHAHTVEAVADQDATCTKDGFSGRTYCAVCDSVVDWGETVVAEGHDWQVVNGVLCCHCNELFNGERDGKIYIDGVIAEGWVNNTYYYVDGVALTGSHFMDGKMYTFDTDGKYLPEFLYDGFYDIDGTVMYFVANEYLTGNQRIGGLYYNFDKNGKGYHGEIELCGVVCTFDKGLSVPTATVKYAGICGPDSHFIILNNGSMMVGGFGEVSDFTTIGLVPWSGSEYTYFIKSLTIGKDITSIGTRAFRGIRHLTSVTFEEGSKLESIHRIAFSYCDDLESIVLPEGLKKIEGSAFLNCTSLKYVYMPSSITAITNDCFADCHADLVLNVVKDTAAYRYAIANGIAYELRVAALDQGICGDTSWTVDSEGVLTISGEGAMADYASGQAPWQAYANKIVKIVIGKDITSIGSFNFAGLKKVTEVVFEEGSKLTTIGRGAFGSCYGLTEITIPASVLVLDTYAMYYCTNLKTVAFEEGSELTTIGVNAFLHDAALENVYIPDKVTTIGVNAFANCISTATFNVARYSYAHDYFAKANLIIREPEIYVIDSGVCGETEWTLTSDGKLTISGSGVMEGNDNGKAPWQDHTRLIRTIVIGKDVTATGKFNFYNLKYVTEVIFEEGSKLETIGWGSFGFLSSLTEITIPASVKVIDNYAFYYCTALKNVKFEDNSELTTINANAFINDMSIETIFVPDKVTFIGANAFRDCIRTATFSVGEGTYAHDYFARYNVVTREPIVYVIDAGDCGDTQWTLTSDGKLTISGSGAMAGNDNGKAPWQDHTRLIRTIVIGKDVTATGKFNFYNLKYVTEVIFEEGSKLETIGWGSFGFLSSLTEITIPASVKVIDNYAFYYCTALKNVKFEDNSELTTINANAFINDMSIETVFVPDKVTFIGANAFRDCIRTATFSVGKGTYAHDYFASYKLSLREPVVYVIDSGDCGDTTWTLTSDGKLTISGSGVMADNENGKAPWQDHTRLIRTIVIGKDVTATGKFNFYNLKYVTEVLFEEGSKLETIGWGSFGFMSALKTVTIPASVKVIDNYAFYYCTGLTTVDFEANSQLVSIGSCAFMNDTALTAVNYPAGTKIYANAFKGCVNFN